jgi:hypothetical protein
LRQVSAERFHNQFWQITSTTTGTLGEMFCQAVFECHFPQVLDEIQEFYPLWADIEACVTRQAHPQRFVIEQISQFGCAVQGA